MTKLKETLFWNTVRAKNFIKEYGAKPSRWEENVAFLAEIGNLSVEQFMLTDPITYGVKIWGYDSEMEPSVKIKKILGIINYYEMYSFYIDAMIKAESIASYSDSFCN